jgi:ESS family glutamate:Na+ symporter
MGGFVLKLNMFQSLALAVVSIWLGQWCREKMPVLKKYCLPGAVVGGTIVSIISLILYSTGVCELSFDYKVANNLFYCIFFAASGAAASLSLLKKGGKLVIIFCISAAVLAILQNILSMGIGKVMGVDPLIALMTGSTPMTGGHGNAAAFAPMAVAKGASAALEVAIASATFGLISGCIIGGPFGRWIIRRHHLEDPALDGQAEKAEETGKEIGTAMFNGDVVKAMYLMCFCLGIGAVFMAILKSIHVSFPIHVCCMLGGILVRLYLDKKGNTPESMYEAINTVGDFSLGLFVSLSIISMKLWQLSGLAGPMMVMLFAQVIFIMIYCYLVDFFICGKNYDAAIIAVGHTGFGLGAVPVSMTTMKTVCDKYRYSKLAFFVVPVIGGFLSNITNAIIITNFINIAAGMR